MGLNSKYMWTRYVIILLMAVLTISCNSKGEEDIKAVDHNISEEAYMVDSNQDELIVYYRLMMRDMGVEEAEAYCRGLINNTKNKTYLSVLNGLLAEKKGDLEEAKKYYLEILSMDSNSFEGHYSLMLFYYEQKQYKEVVSEGEFILANFEKSGINTKLTLGVLNVVYMDLRASYIHLKAYDKAIACINESITFLEDMEHDDPFYLFVEDEILYKLYYITGNKVKIKEYEERWLGFYKITTAELLEMREQASRGKIEYFDFGK